MAGRSPWGPVDKTNSSWAPPTSKRQAPAAKNDHTKDNPKKAFNDNTSAKDNISKKLFGGK